MHLKQVRERLKSWGLYWARQREGAGFGKNSTTSRCMEIMKTEVFSSGTTHLFSNTSESINVPEHIKEVDDVLHELTESELVYLKLRYINLKLGRNLYLDRAENKIAGLI